MDRQKPDSLTGASIHRRAKDANREVPLTSRDGGLSCWLRDLLSKPDRKARESLRRRCEEADRARARVSIRITFGMSAEAVRPRHTVHAYAVQYVLSRAMTTSSERSVSCSSAIAFVEALAKDVALMDDDDEERYCHHNHFLDRRNTPVGLLEYEDYTRAALSSTESHVAIRLCRSVVRVPILGVVPGGTSHLPSTWRDVLTLIRADSLLSLQHKRPKLVQRRQLFMNNWCWLVADGLQAVETRLGHQYFDQ